MITWTVENWVTVMLMAVLGYLLFAFAAQVLSQMFGGGTQSTGTGG